MTRRNPDVMSAFRIPAALFLPALLCGADNTKRPNIVFIVADDLGWNDVDWHGSQQIPTPNLGALARAGVILENYYVQPVCSPTRSSILTGRHVIHSGIYDPDCFANTRSVPLNFTMIPERLKQLDYTSHAIGKWHLGMFTRQAVPTGKGFDTYLGYYGGAEDYYSHEVKSANDMHMDNDKDLEPLLSNKGEYSTFIYAKRAIKVINDFVETREADSDAPQSLFMYLAFQAIHSPDQVPESYEVPFKDTIPDTPDGVGQHRRIVAGMVACLDEAVGNVTAALKAAGIFDETLIIFTTDNGGPAQGFNSNMASNWPLRGMKRTLWQGGVRGVGFASGAGIKNGGTRSSEMIHATDWFPTVLTAAIRGLDGTGEGTWRQLLDPNEPKRQLGDGVDAWDILSKGEPSKRNEIIIEAHPFNTTRDGENPDDGNGQAIIVGDMKLILEKGPQWHGPPNDLWYTSGSNPQLYNHTVKCAPAPDKGPLPPVLFNITADPCEYKDLKDELPDVYNQLLDRLNAYRATAVPVDFHVLPLCDNPIGSVDKPINGTWMPVCP